MGCGKSTTARRVARRLEVSCVDTDAMVEQMEGACVNDIFHYEGEEYFRSAERKVLERLIADEEDMIISTGGGLPTWGDNMELMNQCGVTVWIDRSAEQTVKRLSPHGRQKRPKLRGLSDEEIVEFMQRNMAERKIHYSKATHHIEVDHLNDYELSDLITDIFRNGKQ
ncbi:MAG: shikimate kinase [Alistipes sp.]|nr:shikimate kinase [Alistipes sp.]